MTDDDIKTKLTVLKNKYPDVEIVTMDYRGSGDSFDSYDINVVHKKETPELEPDHKSIQAYLPKKVKTTPSVVESTDLEPIFWELLERVGTNFNNDGSSGTVTFNLVKQIVTVEDYYYSMESHLNGELIIGEEEGT